MKALQKKSDRHQSLDAFSSNETTRVSKWKFLFTGFLYLVAPIFQSVWIYILYENIDQVKRWATMPVIGWIMMFLFVCMIIIIPYLFVIGILLLKKILQATSIRTTPEENKKRKMINILLCVGMMADIFFGYLLLTSQTQDTSATVFACALFGGKILQANLEAVFAYHKM